MSILAGLYGFSPTDVFLGCRFSGDVMAGQNRMGQVRNALQVLRDVNPLDLKIFDYTVSFDDGTIITAHRRFQQYWAEVYVKTNNVSTYSKESKSDIYCIYYKDSKVYASRIGFSKNSISVESKDLASKYGKFIYAYNGQESYIRTFSKGIKVGGHKFYFMAGPHFGASYYANSINDFYHYSVRWFSLYNVNQKKYNIVPMSSNGIASPICSFNFSDKYIFSNLAYDSVAQAISYSVSDDGDVSFGNVISLHDLTPASGPWVVDFISTTGDFYCYYRANGNAADAFLSRDYYAFYPVFGTTYDQAIDNIFSGNKEVLQGSVTGGEFWTAISNQNALQCSNPKKIGMSLSGYVEWMVHVVEAFSEEGYIKYGSEIIEYSPRNTLASYHKKLNLPIPIQKNNEIVDRYFFAYKTRDNFNPVELHTPYGIFTYSDEDYTCDVLGMSHIERNNGDVLQAILVKSGRNGFSHIDTLVWHNGIRVDDLLSRKLNIEKQYILGFIHIPTE